MEFAASAIFLLVLLLPGFILQTAYTKGFWRWNSPTSNRSLSEQIPAGIVLAGVLHVLWCSVATALGYKINLTAIFMILTGTYGRDEANFDRAISWLTNNASRISFYFASLYLFAASLGYVLHFAVRRLRLDKTTRIFRFNNHWFYLLSGEIAQFADSPIQIDDEIDGIWLTTVVHHSDADYVYKGVVTDFFYDREGNLDRVYLVVAARRKLADDRKDEPIGSPESEARYYPIEGDYLVLRYAEMSTINIDYFFVVPEDIADDEAQDA
jgi:hypothetical protein